MAVNDDANGWVALLLCRLAIACAIPAAVRAEAPNAAPQPAPRLEAQATTTDRADHEATSQRWRDFWSGLEQRVHGRGEPDWLRHRSGNDAVDPIVPAGEGAVCIVLQDDRPDGTQLLTARYTLHDQGALRAYAGAGLNRAQYFHDSAEPGPTFFTKRNRRTSLGPAAELGAQLRLSERVLVNADARWADLHDDAAALRSEHGPVMADPVMLGLSVGYRFR
jgi:hypothetical protein